MPVIHHPFRYISKRLTCFPCSVLVCDVKAAVLLCSRRFQNKDYIKVAVFCRTHTTKEREKILLLCPCCLAQGLQSVMTYLAWRVEKETGEKTQLPTPALGILCLMMSTHHVPSKHQRLWHTSTCLEGPQSATGLHWCKLLKVDEAVLHVLADIRLSTPCFM